MGGSVRLKDVNGLVFSNTRAIISDFEPGVVEEDPRNDASVWPAISLDVRQQVAKDLADATRIGNDARGRNRELSNFDTQSFDSCLQLGLKIDHGRFDCHPPHLGPGRHQQIIDDIGHLDGLIGHQTHEFRAFIIAERVHRAHLRCEAYYSGQWCAQLVADPGNELVLGLDQVCHCLLSRLDVGDVGKTNENRCRRRAW